MPAAKGSVPWNAGTSKGWIDKRGYRWVYVTENGKRRARRDHRVLMEQHLGRRLEPWEIVHHRDENPSNNSLDNLEIKTFGEHTAGHHTGTRKDYDSRRSMEAFALMREELKAERALKAELLEALKYVYDIWIEDNGSECNQVESAALARLAIAKATGETE